MAAITGRKTLAYAGGTLAVAALALGVRAAQAAPVDLAVGTADTASCSESLVTVDYDVDYSHTSGGYVVRRANVSGLDPSCAQTVTVRLTGPNGTPVAEMSSPVTGTTHTLAVPTGSPVRAEAVMGVSVALSG